MMTAMPYNLQGKGVVDVSGISQISSKWRNIAGGTKLTARTTTNSIDSGPTSILDTRRSPSPPTSTSTLSSFNGGGSGGRSSAGGGGTENKDEVAALFDNTHIKCPISLPESTSESPRKEDWAVKLQNLHNGSDIVRGCCSVAAGCGCGSASAGDGLGIGDFENIFPGGDGALLPWIIGETDDLDLGLKHLLQSGNPSEYEATGIGVFEQSSGMGGILAEGVSGEGSLVASMNSNLGFPGSGFNHYGKIDSMPPSCSSGILHCKQGNGNNGLNHIPQINLFTHLPSNLQIPVSLQTGVVLQQQQQFHVSDEKPQTFSPQMLMNQQQAQSIQNPSFLLPPSGYCQLEQHLSQPQAKRHNLGAALDGSIVQVSKSPFPDQGHEFLLRKHQQQQQFPVALAPQSVVTHHLQQKTMVSNKKVVSMGNEIAHQHYQLQQHQHLQEQAVRDHLFKAADLIQTGNFSHAQEILARLNHLLSLPAKPLMRAALYVKEALQLLLLLSNPVAVPQPKCLSPFDVVHKMNAYKAFSEVSPFMQFVNFTCTQAILEALDDADAIHIVDFDIGCGAKWASFMQELPLRKRGTPSLKITAFASASTNHPFELALMRDNLTQFANDIGIAFDLQVVNLDSFDPSNPTTPSFLTLDNESIAVSFPIWASSTRPHVIPSLLRFIKHQSPKIMVSLDRGCDRCDIPFTQHILHALDSCTNLLESLDSLSIASEVVNKVEKFFVQPTIESSIVGRLHAPDKIPHWKNLFASAGFSPLAFSNFTETQADYVVKRTPGKGFHVDKRQASLVLSWQRRELVAASAWRC